MPKYNNDARCLRCGHAWTKWPSTVRPSRCPKCKSRIWDRTEDGGPAPATIQLPNTCPENRQRERHNSNTYVLLLSAVSADAWNSAGFEGKLYAPGARMSAELLGPRPVLLECAGAQGANRKERLEGGILWVLWRYDYVVGAWREVARAVADDWSWSLILREPARRALALEVVDSRQRGRELSADILKAIEAALSPEPRAVQAVALTSLYDHLAGLLSGIGSVPAAPPALGASALLIEPPAGGLPKLRPAKRRPAIGAG